MAGKKKVAEVEGNGIGTGGEVQKAMEKGQDHKKQQSPAGEEEKQQRESEGRTRGRKGCKAPRISLCTTAENYQFVKVMSRLTGRPMTEYINFVLDEYRKDHPGLYEKAVEVMKEAGINVVDTGDGEA